MLDHREQKLLVEIEHRLRLENPELVRTFEPAPPRSAHGRHHGALVPTAAGVTLCAVLWIGPRPLTDAEVTTRAAAGPPRVTPAPPALPRPRFPRSPLPHETRGRT